MGRVGDRVGCGVDPEGARDRMVGVLVGPRVGDDVTPVGAPVKTVGDTVEGVGDCEGSKEDPVGDGDGGKVVEFIGRTSKTILVIHVLFSISTLFN